MIAKELVKSLVEERIAERDEKLYIVDIIIRNGNQILIELDKEDGAVSIEDCIAISRNVEHNLDRDQEDFSLEVSSAGMTNPFKVTKQYLKNVGREVKVQLFEHGKSIEGTLLSADDEGIIVEKKEKVKVEGKNKKEWVTTEIPLKYVEIKETKLQISF